MRYEIYESSKIEKKAATEWRWRLAKITNNRVIAYSADSFKSKEDCQNDIYLVMVADYKTPVVVFTGSKQSH